VTSEQPSPAHPAPSLTSEDSPKSIPSERAQAALDRYNARMRRLRSIYAAVIAVVVIAVAVVVRLAWSHGEIAHTTLRTASAPPPAVALQGASARQQLKWQSTDRTAIGTPYWGGTVVTYSADSVRGRDATTGQITWSYTRTGRTVCQAIQDQGVTIAIFELHGNCDQVTALDSNTGARKWTRTLDKDGKPLDGRPSYAVAQYTILLTTPSIIYAIDPGGGLDRWTFAQAGCTIHSAVLGSQGALISQTCVQPNCAGLKFCGAGRQLLLRDATAGRSDDDKNKGNPDQIKWNLIGSSAVPASADQLISAVDTTANRLDVLDVTKGSTLGKLALHGTGTGPGPVAQLATTHAELLWIGGVTYSVELTGADFFWAAPTSGPPTVTPLAPTSLPDLNQSFVAVAGVSGSAGAALLEPGTGKVRTSFAVDAPADALVYPFGSGFIVAGSTTKAFR
jgi:outer membrane protein assembly factor BamB